MMLGGGVTDGGRVGQAVAGSKAHHVVVEDDMIQR
jgi:hypothetical protein